MNIMCVFTCGGAVVASAPNKMVNDTVMMTNHHANTAHTN